MTDSKTRIGSTAKAQLSIQKANGETVDIHVQLDSGGSQNLASREILQNVRKAHDYGRTPIYMVTVSGDTPAYYNMGELHFTDAEDNPIVIICFVQEQAIKGHDKFALICSDTSVDMKADINYHAETSKQGKILLLKRLISQPYHYEDDSDTKGKLALSNNKLLHSVATESSTDVTEIAPVIEQDKVQVENEVQTTVQPPK